MSSDLGEQAPRKDQCLPYLQEAEICIWIFSQEEVLGSLDISKRDLDLLGFLFYLSQPLSNRPTSSLWWEVSCINCWGNCGPVTLQKHSQKLYVVTNSLRLLMCGRTERVAWRHFKINEFLMTLEFSQGICSVNPILGFLMWDSEVDKASSYIFFIFTFKLIGASGWNYFKVLLFLSHTGDDNTWLFKIHWWSQANNVIQFLIGNVNYSHWIFWCVVFQDNLAWFIKMWLSQDNKWMIIHFFNISNSHIVGIIKSFLYKLICTLTLSNRYIPYSVMLFK